LGEGKEGERREHKWMEQGKGKRGRVRRQNKGRWKVLKLKMIKK